MCSCKDSRAGAPDGSAQAGAPSDPGRRRVLAALAVAPVVGAAGAACSKYQGKVLTARPAADGSFVVPTSQLAPLRSPRDAIFVDAPGYAKKISLRKLADGSYVALMMKCTHWGCTVDPLPEGNVCPCHGAQYDLQGKVIKGPAKKPLKRLAVTVVPGGVRIAKP